MKLRRNGVIIILLFVIVVAGVVWLMKPQEGVVTQVADQAAQVGSSADVNELIARSAVEMQNPLAGAMEAKTQAEKSGVAPVVISPICTGADTGVFDCYEKHYQQIVKDKGVKAAFADLRPRYEKDQTVVAMCHPLTHVIGNASVLKYPTVSEAYSQGDSFCWSGYYHGVLEGIVKKIGKENIISQLNTICADVPGKGKYSFDYYNCVHGLGHGLMAMTNNELFQSLEMCDSLTGEWEKSSCYGGAFMENVIVDNKNHFTAYLKPSEPLYPCTAVGERYKSACYLMQTSYMLKVLNRDFVKVFALCEQADANYKATCFQSVGRDASGSSSSNIESTKKTCNLGQDFTARSNCIIGAVKDFISYFHSDVQAKQFCNSLDSDLQQICLVTGDTYYKNL